MSYRLVTLEQARVQLNYDGTYADEQLSFRLDAVSRALMDYIGNSVALAGWTDSSGKPLVDSSGDPLLDANGDSVIPGQVQAATICAMAEWDDNRSGDVITPAVESLLRRTRDPAVI